MPTKAKELSAKAVRDLKHPTPGVKARPVTFAVGGVSGLLMQITYQGGRTWILRTIVGGKRREIGLGGFPDVPLADARAAARAMKAEIVAGVCPVEKRRAARAALMQTQAGRVTWAQAVEEYLTAQADAFRNAKHRKQWRSTLDAYAAPVLADKPVADVSLDDVLAVLQPIWTGKTETASRLRGRIESVLSYATAKGWRSGDNPARWKGNIDAVLPAPGKLKKVAHHPALTLADAPAWFADLQARDGMATRALEFTALTAARSGEVRGATWAEIDLAAAVWTIPASRMKAGKEHRVPLTPGAVALLERLPRGDATAYVFPAMRGGQLSDMALSACMRRINEAKPGGYLDARTGRPAVPHGLRSTFRDWAQETTDYPREMAEIQLAHVVGSEAERAYRRADALEKRRAMMLDWEKTLRGAEK